MGAFVISKRWNDHYKFVYTSRKGKAIFTSISFELKFECEAAIAFFKENYTKCEFPITKNQAGKYLFRIVLATEQIAVSRKFSTELRAIKGIDEIKKYAMQSEILDFSVSDFIFSDES